MNLTTETTTCHSRIGFFLKKENELDWDKMTRQPQWMILSHKLVCGLEKIFFSSSLFYFFFFGAKKIIIIIMTWFSNPSQHLFASYVISPGQKVILY